MLFNFSKNSEILNFSTDIKCYLNIAKLFSKRNCFKNILVKIVPYVHSSVFNREMAGKARMDSKVRILCGLKIKTLDI